MGNSLTKSIHKQFLLSYLLAMHKIPIANSKLCILVYLIDCNIGSFGYDYSRIDLYPYSKELSSDLNALKWRNWAQFRYDGWINKLILEEPLSDHFAYKLLGYIRFVQPLPAKVAEAWFWEKMNLKTYMMGDPLPKDYINIKYEDYELVKSDSILGNFRLFDVINYLRE